MCDIHEVLCCFALIIGLSNDIRLHCVYTTGITHVCKFTHELMISVVVYIKLSITWK